MKLSKEYLTERLQNTSVQDLAEELTDKTAVAGMDRAATIKRYKTMLRPFAPKKEMTATELMESMGIHVVRIN